MTPAHTAEVTAAVLAPDGATAITGDLGGQRILWRRDGQAVVLSPVAIAPQRGFALFGAGPAEWVRWIAVSADGRVAASAHEGGVVAVFDARTGAAGPVVPLDLRGEPEGRWTRLVLPEHPDGELGGCGTGEPRALPTPALSADGRRLVTSGFSAGVPLIRLWETKTGAVLESWTTDEPVATLGFDAAGEPVVHAGATLVVLARAPRFVAHEVQTADLRPDGSAIVTRADGTRLRLDPATGAVAPAGGAPTETEPAVRVVGGRAVFD